jgi:hypothetical protein
MKRCPYCGAEYPDDAVMCPVDHTPFDQPAGPKPSPPPKRIEAQHEFVALAESERQNDWVTLVRCGTLLAADMLASRLRSAGIEAFIPDEFLMQAIAFNLNAYGFVRVQVAPKDYDAARELLDGPAAAE